MDSSITPPDQDVREQVLDISQSFHIQAPAGSGKTELLTQWALKCLARVNKPEEVLFITFTNKAANEARSRIVGALVDAKAADLSGELPDSPHKQQTFALARAVLARDSELGWNLIKNPNRLRVMTFDSLNAQLAAQLPILSGFGGPARIEDQPFLLYRKAVDNLFQEFEAEATEESTREALAALLRFAENRLEDLKPLLINLLSTRDQWLGQLHAYNNFDMESALVALVTDRLNRAQMMVDAGLRQELVSILSCSPHEKHQEFAGVNQWPSADPDNLPLWQALVNVLLTGTGTFRKRITVKEGFPPKEELTLRMKSLLESFNGLDACDEVAHMLNEVRNLPDITYPEHLDRFRLSIAVILYRLAAHLRLVFKESGTVDFIEVAMRAHEALGSDEVFNDALLKLDYTISHILVDEQQDTSLTQYKLLTQMTSGWEAGDGRSICFCGDPQQSIYSFRQAEVGLFQTMRHEGAFNQIPLTCVTLTTNFRSEAGVVDWFNRAFTRIFPKREDAYTSAVTFSHSTPFLPAGSGEAVRVTGFLNGDNGKEEAASIVAVIKEVQARDPEGSIAILTRGRSHVQEIIPALREAEIPYSCQDIDPLLNKSAVSDVVCLIRALWHPMDRTAWMAVLRAPFVGLSWEDCVALVKGHLHAPLLERISIALREDLLSSEGSERAARLLKCYEQVMGDESCAHALRRRAQTLWYALGGPACVTPAQANDINRLFKLLDDHCTGGTLNDIEAFEAGVRVLYASPEVGAVQILTMHKSKGLEFDTVILPGLNRSPRRDDRPLLHHGHLPGGYLIAPNPGKYAKKDSPEMRLYEYMCSLNRASKQFEAYRLLYVAITRARKHLHLLGSITPGKKDGAGKPGAGTFLGYLWPVVKDCFTGIAAKADDDVEYRPHLHHPIAPRLPLTWQRPEVADQYVPRVNVASLPSEMAISGEEGEATPFDENINQRIIGTLYHALMQRISDEGVAGWGASQLETQRQALVAGCRRMGMPEPDVNKSVADIIQLAKNTLADKTGVWILSQREIDESELRLSGFMDNNWTAGIIDRFFFEEDIAWIIDYKTGGLEIAPPKQAAFIKNEIRRYREQLQDYAKLINARYQCEQIKTGLYFPALQQLVEVEIQGNITASVA